MSLLVPLAILSAQIIGIAGAIAIFTYILLKITELIMWFKRRKNRIGEQYKEQIRSTIGARIEKGEVLEIDCDLFNKETEKFNMIQYLYDAEKDEVVEARAIVADSLDNIIKDIHNQAARENKAVIYNNI